MNRALWRQPVRVRAIGPLRPSGLRNRMIRGLVEVTTRLRGDRASDQPAAMLLDIVQARLN